MGLFVTLVNYKLANDGMKKLMAGIATHIPKNGGALITHVYQQPPNASSYGFTAELFMYAYVLAYGTTARDAYFRYIKDQELRTGGTVSQGTLERWSKVERHIWVSGAKP
ncbi:hypothetical protein JYJ95_11650 [Corallococcus exiguus]|uniref:hypothetical protein n=1 Tax=Corallococcus exiguus TaxID=83462 RepID=UPI001A8E016F|nr:hypothetical protein [Corallococcus exiguus]MBN8467174.1 hypothetical protein [Corallococcus exiguus]